MSELSGILIVIGLIVGLPFASFEAYRFFAPKYAQVERDVFVNTQGYNEGMVRDLENLRLQYLQAKPEQQEALKAVILHRFSTYPTDRLPLELASFYNQLRSVQ